ncbi:MAG: hypothetical protein IPF87_10565 [Gemmatimonadetes bacterium]|nr:hypothetical protein [Gemmatimonadota bacterium]
MKFLEQLISFGFRNAFVVAEFVERTRNANNRADLTASQWDIQNYL